ncbi:MAG: hypothetical protein LQ343_005694 [Gyalolechia ehrenbergii]|nr:MAG: hypothetical protein LQ343_005694 [Gyalolechia ehrenbergii]
MSGRMRPLFKAIFGILGLTNVVPQVGVNIDPVIMAPIEEVVFTMTTLPAGTAFNSSLLQGAGGYVPTFIHKLLSKMTGALRKFDFTLLLLLLLCLYFLFDLSRTYFFGRGVTVAVGKISAETDTLKPAVKLQSRFNDVNARALARKARKRKPKGIRQSNSQDMGIIRWWRKKYLGAIAKIRKLKHDIDISTAALQENEKNLLADVASLRVEVATVQTEKKNVECQLDAADGKLHKANDDLREHRERNDEMQNELKTLKQESRMQADSILRDQQRHSRELYKHEQIVEDLKAKLNIQRITNNDLQAQVSKISKEKSIHEGNVRHLQQTLNSVHDKMAQQSSELEALRTGKDRTAAAINQQLTDEKKALESKNGALADEIDVLREARRIDAERIESIQTLEKQKSDEIAQLQEKMAMQDEKIIDLGNEKDLVDAMHSDTLKEKEDKLDEAAQKLADLTEKHGLAEQEKARLNKQVQGLELQLTAVQSSAGQAGGDDCDSVSTNTVPAYTDTTETVQDEPTPVETAPDTAPADTTTADTTPADTTPADTTLAETIPTDTTPADTTPADTTLADTIPTDTTPADTTPADTTPPDTTPADDLTAETMPTQIDTSFNPEPAIIPEGNAHDDHSTVANYLPSSNITDDTIPFAVVTGSAQVQDPNVDEDDHGNPDSDSNVRQSEKPNTDTTTTTISDTHPMDFSGMDDDFNQGHWLDDWSYFANNFDLLDPQNFAEAMGDYDPMVFGESQNELDPEQSPDDTSSVARNYGYTGMDHHPLEAENGVEPTGGDDQMEHGGDQNEANEGQFPDDTAMNYDPLDAKDGVEPTGGDDQMELGGDQNEADEGQFPDDTGMSYDPLDAEDSVEPTGGDDQRELGVDQNEVDAQQSPNDISSIASNYGCTGTDQNPIDVETIVGPFGDNDSVEYGVDEESHNPRDQETSEDPPQADGSEPPIWDSSLHPIGTTSTFTFAQAAPTIHSGLINWDRPPSPVTNRETDLPPNMNDNQETTTKGVRKFSDDEQPTAKKQAKIADFVSDPPPPKLDTTGLDEEEQYSQFVESEIVRFNDPKTHMSLVDAHVRAYEEVEEAKKKAEEEKRRIISPFSDYKPKSQPLPVPPKHSYPFTRIIDYRVSSSFPSPIKAAPYIPPHGRVSLAPQQALAWTPPGPGPRPGVGVDGLPIGPPMPGFMRVPPVTSPGYSPTNPMYAPKLPTEIPLIGPPKDDGSDSESEEDDEDCKRASAPVVQDSKLTAPAESGEPKTDERSRKTKQNQRSRRRAKRMKERKKAALDEKSTSDAGNRPDQKYSNLWIP